MRDVAFVLFAAMFTLLATSCREVHRQEAHAPSATMPAEPQKPVEGDLFAGAASLVVEGRFLKSFAVAVAAHTAIPDLTEQQRDVANYAVEFSEDARRIYVLFIPRIPEGTFPSGGDTPYGRTARYTLDKKSYRLLDRAFFE